MDLREFFDGIRAPLRFGDHAQAACLEITRLFVAEKRAILLNFCLQRLLALPRLVDLLWADAAVGKRGLQLLLRHDLHGVVKVLADHAHLAGQDKLGASFFRWPDIAEGQVVVDHGDAGQLSFFAVRRIKAHEKVAGVTVNVAADEVNALHGGNVVERLRIVKVLCLITADRLASCW